VIVKICGVTRPEDAEVAAQAGADWIGLNFWPRSRRYVALERAVEVAAAIPGDVKKVGVFVNAPAPTVVDVAHRVGLDILQFHGDEDAHYLAAFAEEFAGRTLQALRVRDATDLRLLEQLAGVDTVLLDAPSDSYGGSGRTFDWTLARQAKAHGKRIVLAGGLTPENVAQAIREVRPFGVDVAGGVEASPGVKDADKIRRFLEAAKGIAR
jgi:phosphoribosylanthranilate isomerase